MSKNLPVDSCWAELYEFERQWNSTKGWNIGPQFKTPAKKRIALRNERPSMFARIWQALNTPITQLIF